MGCHCLLWNYRLDNSKCLLRASSFADRKVTDRSHHPAHPLWWKGRGSSGSKVAGDTIGSGIHKMLLSASGGERASNEGRLSESGDIFKIYFNCFQNVLLKTNRPEFSSVSCWLKGVSCMLSCV